VARVSHVAAVRNWMLGFQRGCARFGSLVMDGRDIGTRIFNETPFKFFIYACEKVREKRGTHAGHGGGVALRDRIDADLNQAAPDAVLVDTSEHTVAMTVAAVMAELQKKAPGQFR
jgi:cytidylate kinase